MNTLLAWVANTCYIVACIIFLPVVLYRMIRSGRYRRGWRNRFGLLPKRYTDRPVIWVHAVSVGEVNAARSLIQQLTQQLPFHDIYVSVTTDTGYNRACQILGREKTMFFPFDFTFTMRLALQRLRPSIIILMELEVWFNLVNLARRADIPVMVANGRITQRSAARYRWVKPWSDRMFRQLTFVAAQDETYAKRFAALGVPQSKLLVTKSLKWDIAPSCDHLEDTDKLARALGIDVQKPLLVAGSTGSDLEEEAIIRAYQQLRSRCDQLQLAIIPRKPERFDAAAKLITGRGFCVIRRSEHPDDNAPHDRPHTVKQTVILGDTMGELRKFYSLATVVFLGRSLVPMGGSDVMEVAGLGKPTIFGPHMENFAEATACLLQAGAAVQVDRPERLASAIGDLLADTEKLDHMSQAARQTVIDNQGATQATAKMICQLLGMEYDQTGNSIATPALETAAPNNDE